MNGLKTLGKLDCFYVDDPYGEMTPYDDRYDNENIKQRAVWIDKDELCLEAINWCKKSNMELWEFLEADIEDGCVDDIYMLKIGLKKFFNISEGDLK
ncbi:MAG: hypothetical protein Q8O88_01010 [bacterium]|nr:hypothetical protein [bacterium]